MPLPPAVQERKDRYESLVARLLEFTAAGFLIDVKRTAAFLQDYTEPELARWFKFIREKGAHVGG